MNHPVKFLRVLGVRSKFGGEVFAICAGYRVSWDQHFGWRCDCPTDAEACEHVDQVEELLDPKVLGDAG